MEENRICGNCGAKLPKEASFCPHCATVLTEKESAKIPILWRRKALLVVVAICIAVIAFLALSSYHKPQLIEADAELLYSDKSGDYRMVLSFYGETAYTGRALAEESDTLPEGSNAAYPCQLYIFDQETGEPAESDFTDKIKSCTVKTVPLDGARQMEISGPGYNEYFPEAYSVADIIYYADCGTNEIYWTLEMENGDQLGLKAVIRITKQETVTYDAADTPMSTAEELQSLLDTIEEEIPSDTVVYLYLPAVTYDDEISFGNHPFVISGQEDANGRTTFAGTVTMQAQNKSYSKMTGVAFEGDGGIGLESYSTVFLTGCTFRGWDTGAFMQEGSWIGAVNCTFEENGVGLYFGSSSSSGVDPYYTGDNFTGNKVAVRVETLPENWKLDFSGSTFSGNGTDVENENENPVDVSGAVFE